MFRFVKKQRSHHGNLSHQPLFNDKKYMTKLYADYETFLNNIFDNDIAKSYRRSLVYRAKEYNDYLCSEITNKKTSSLVCKIKRIIRRNKYE